MKPLSKEFPRYLLKWYKAHARDLPWRLSKDPYKIWISEIMLQQTTVNTVIPHFIKWFDKFPDIQTLSRSKIQTVLNQWQGLGYYSRARNIHKAAKIIVKDFNGRIPSKHQELRKLPGFGPYTTGAVLSIAFNVKAAIVDANVRRVMMRILGIEGKADGKIDALLYEKLENVLPDQKIGDFNQSLMELGALICKSKEPLCNQCSVKIFCKAYELGIQEIIPLTVRKTISTIPVVVGIVSNNRKYLIKQRPSSGILADLWEFPGVQIEKSETSEQALMRFFKNDLFCEIVEMEHFLDINHFYTQYKIQQKIFRCSFKVFPQISNHYKYVSIKQFDQLPMTSGSSKIVEHLKLIHSK